MTIDELARRAGTTARQVRALQSRGLLAHPSLVGRTGFYGKGHLDRLGAILRLQREGFSLDGIGVLLRALDAGLTLEHVVGLRRPADDSPTEVDGSVHATEDLDGDDDFSGWPDTANGRLLAVVPPALLDLSMAS